MKAKQKGITYKEVEKMLERNANISDHYSTLNIKKPKGLTID